MTDNPFANVEGCVFDAYGTLFDVHSAVARHRDALGERAQQVSQLWRSKQLEYTWLRSLMHRHADFWQVTGDALDYALDACGVDDTQLRSALMAAYLELAPYPEVADVLARLRAAGLRLALLSNGTPKMLDAAVRSAGIEALVDDVLSIEEVGVYKTDPRAYRLAVDRLGIAADSIAFFSSNAWDVAGAAAFGFRVVWINRFGQRPERLPGQPLSELGSLADVLVLLGRSA